MTTKIILIANSPLGFFLARELDSTLARRVDCEVSYYSSEKNMVVMSEQVSLLGASSVFDQTAHLPHLRLCPDKIKGIDLARRKVLTEKGEAGYDFLIIDRTPYISLVELSKIRQAFLHLLAQLKVMSRRKQATHAAITFTGEDCVSWQLALAAQTNLNNESVEIRSNLRIRAIAHQDLAEFMAHYGIEQTETSCPGVKIAPFNYSLPVSRIKGAVVDHSGLIMSEPAGNLARHSEVFVTDSPVWRTRNCSLTLAKQAMHLVANLSKALEGKKLLSLEDRYPSLMLRAGWQSFFWHRSTVSTRVRGLAASVAERKFWRRFNLRRSSTGRAVFDGKLPPK